MAVSQRDIDNLNARVTKIDERVSGVDGRLIKIETSLGNMKWALSILTAFVVGWGAFITVNVIAMRQLLADGGTHQLVTQLQKAKTPEAVAANMSLLKGEVQLASSQQKVPNLPKVRTLSDQVGETLKRFPDVPESWSAAAALVSYSTMPVLPPPELPLCQTTGLEPRWIEQGEVPEIRFDIPSVSKGYLFRDCKLLLSALPGKSLTVHATASTSPELTLGDHRLGVLAYAVNVTVVLDDRGVSDTDILQIQTVGCRFAFALSEKPKQTAQRLLLAALQNPIPGKAILPV